MSPVLFAIIQGMLFLLFAPLVTAYIKKLKAVLQSRKGPGIFQSYYDLIKLLRKDSVVSEHASWIFIVTPYIGLAAVMTSCLMVPLLAGRAPLGFVGDFVLMVYLFALARFFTALSGLDAGSSFGGMGSSREMTIASLIEPAMILSIFSLALTAGSLNLSTMARALASQGASLINPGHILALAAFSILVIAETGRLPVDNPATHLELTMVHEAMVLENSGRNLALVEIARSVKQLILFTIIANIFFPFGLTSVLGAVAILGSFILLLAKLAMIGLLVAVVETSTAKYRFFRLPDILSVSFVLSFLALVFHFMTGGV